jgi:predicted nucleotidyltransferase
MDTDGKTAMLRNLRDYSGEITTAIRELLPDADVVVFANVVRGEVVPSNDIDLLVV